MVKSDQNDEKKHQNFDFSTPRKKRSVYDTSSFFFLQFSFHDMKSRNAAYGGSKHVESVFITLQTSPILGIPCFGRFPSLVGFTLIFGFSRKNASKNNETTHSHSP